jgi:ribosomal protein S18 acetylase RimI-like enzyme
LSEKINFENSEVEFVKLQMLDGIDKTFETEVDEYTDYYKVQSQYDMDQGLSRTYLLKVDGRILGYVSIAMAHLRKETTSKTFAKESEGNIPALLISHIATHKEFQRNGIGTKLVDEALRIAVESSENIGCRYLMLNPRDDDGVRKFYIKYGFTYIPNIEDDKERDAFILDIKQEKETW